MASFVSTKLISLVEAKKVAFGTVLSLIMNLLYIDFFRRGIIARHAPRRRKRGVVNNFRGRETQIYQLFRLSALETWHLWMCHMIETLQTRDRDETLNLMTRSATTAAQ